MDLFFCISLYVYCEQYNRFLNKLNKKTVRGSANISNELKKKRLNFALVSTLKTPSRYQGCDFICHQVFCLKKTVAENIEIKIIEDQIVLWHLFTPGNSVHQLILNKVILLRRFQFHQLTSQAFTMFLKHLRK